MGFVQAFGADKSVKYQINALQHGCEILTLQCRIQKLQFKYLLEFPLWPIILTVLITPITH